MLMVKENYRLKELGALEKMKPSITDFTLLLLLLGSCFYLVQIYFIHTNRKAIIARFTKSEND